jgi:glucan phosphoethanolaminetransferase (alkaline phosphatase superfamily)
MIYELEKVQLYGISWLNYSIIGLILTILLIMLFILWIYKTIYKRCKLHPGFILMVSYLLGAFTFVCIITTIIITANGNYRSNTVPLSKIDNKITVQGEKVVIEELDELYNYHEYSEDSGKFGQRKASRNNRQIFKFEYDELYESGKLIQKNGGYYILSKGDINYLKEKGREK